MLLLFDSVNLDQQAIGNEKSSQNELKKDVKNHRCFPFVAHFRFVRFNGTVNIWSFWCQGCIQTEVLSGNHKPELNQLSSLLY